MISGTLFLRSIRHYCSDTTVAFLFLTFQIRLLIWLAEGTFEVLFPGLQWKGIVLNFKCTDLEQWSSKFSGHQNHPRASYTRGCWAPRSPDFSFRGAGVRLRMCSSSKYLSDANASRDTDQRDCPWLTWGWDELVCGPPLHLPFVTRYLVTLAPSRMPMCLQRAETVYCPESFLCFWPDQIYTPD